MGRRCLRERFTLDAVRRLPHPFIVQLSWAAQDDDGQFLLLAMDQAGAGDLLALIERRGPLTPRETRFYLSEVALALGHLHSMDIVYRNLKPEHILVHLDGHIVIGDLSAACRMSGPACCRRT